MTTATRSKEKPKHVQHHNAATDAQPSEPKPRKAAKRPTSAKKAKAAKKAKHTKKAAAKPAAERSNKKAEVIALMKRAKGATLGEIVEATGWQKHTVRGFVSTLGSKIARRG